MATRNNTRRERTSARPGGKRLKGRRTVRRPAKPAKGRRARLSAPLPLLSRIIFAFCDAQALVTAAHKAILHTTNWGPEEPVLRFAIKELEGVFHQLDAADLQLAQFKRRLPKALRGAA